jgi:hypothetical protein
MPWTRMRPGTCVPWRRQPWLARLLRVELVGRAVVASFAPTATLSAKISLSSSGCSSGWSSFAMDAS